MQKSRQRTLCDLFPTYLLLPRTMFSRQIPRKEKRNELSVREARRSTAACTQSALSTRSLAPPPVASPAPLLQRAEEAERSILSKREPCLRIPWVDSIAVAWFQESFSSSLSASWQIPATDGRGVIALGVTGGPS